MNKVMLLGRLTKDPELKYTQATNTAVCKFSIAVNRKFSKDNEADFFNIVAWEKTAEFCGKYFQKGKQVVIVGNIQNRSWDDKEGKKCYITEIVATECYFADSKPVESSDSKSELDVMLEQESETLPF